MANVAKLKDRARAFEQKEQWKEALEAYQQLVDEAAGEEVDAGLWNRIGDLHLRTGRTDRAVEAYEQAVDAYAETGLHNNAIALCRKVLRIAPAHVSIYLKLGQISAAQGFLADARQNFLEYAQRMQRAGQMDASFAALKEFADLSPEDTDLRLLLAEQLRAHGRSDEAVEQLRALLRHLRRTGREAEADEVVRQIREIDPDADVAPDLAVEEEREEEALPGLAIDLPGVGGEGPAEAEAPAVEPLPGLDPGAGLQEIRAEEVEIRGLEGLETSETYARLEEEDGEGAVDLPLLDPEEAADGEDLPTLLLEPYAGEEEEEEGVEPLPLLDFDAPPAADPLEVLRARVAAAPEDARAVHELVELLDSRGLRGEAETVLEGAHRALAAGGRLPEALDALRALLARRPSDTLLHQKQVEYAFRAGDAAPLVRAYLDLGRHLGSPAENPKSRAVFQRVLELDPGNEEARRVLAPPPAPPAPAPAAPVGDYVDLGALILDDEPDETTTRFVVPEEEPTGDEDRDFADMLSVFRQKVSENIGAEDSSSHYDLGMAFMEMGLVDEAISEFQVALRGGANPLATLELLGRCFAEKGQFAVASRVLERALRVPGTADTELIGVTYQLARCEEALGNAAAAREHLERVVALDIGFRDAASRLEALRAAAPPPGF